MTIENPLSRLMELSSEPEPSVAEVLSDLNLFYIRQIGASLRKVSHYAPSASVFLTSRFLFSKFWNTLDGLMTKMVEFGAKRLALKARCKCCCHRCADTFDPYFTA